MRPVEFEMHIYIAAPPDEVWPYLVDWERLGRWMQEGSDFRVTSSHREGLGVEAVAKIRIAGLSTLDPIRVSRWQPPHLLEIEHLGWVKGTGTQRCSPGQSGTNLFWKERFIAPLGFLGATGMRIWKPFMQRAFEKDLVRLKGLIESDRVTKP
jgi:uncharacterized membrane protein